MNKKVLPAIYSTAFWCLFVVLLFFWLYCVTTSLVTRRSLLTRCPRVYLSVMSRLTIAVESRIDRAENAWGLGYVTTVTPFNEVKAGHFNLWGSWTSRNKNAVFFAEIQINCKLFSSSPRGRPPLPLWKISSKKDP